MTSLVEQHSQDFSDVFRELENISLNQSLGKRQLETAVDSALDCN